MLRISSIYVYPIKSFGGISLSSALVTDRGLQYDRRWMLVDKENCFISQRQLPGLALFKTSIKEFGIEITHKTNGQRFFLDFDCEENEWLSVRIWDDLCRARVVSKAADEWFSSQL